MRTHYHALLIGAFAVLLFSGMLGSIFRWDFYELQENRRLAAFPEFNRTPLNEWPDAFEVWFDDHFGFRNTFIRRYRKLMQKAGITNFRLLCGTDDWLYLNDGSIMKDFIGNLDSNVPAAGVQVDRLESRKLWFDSKQIPYLFVLVPNKVSIYPEHLPEDIVKLRVQPHRERFMTEVNSRQLSYVLNLTPVLINAKEAEVVFLRSDSHWNPHGAYIAYTNITQKVRQILPEAAFMMPPSDLINSIETFTGDLAKMSISPDRYQMKIDQLIYSQKETWQTHTIEQTEFLREETLPVDKKAPYTIHNPAGEFDAVIFHDSFALRLVEYLPYNFRNTTFIWKYSNPEMMELVIQYLSPDIVIEQVVERHLVDPKNGALLEMIEKDNHGL